MGESGVWVEVYLYYGFGEFVGLGGGRVGGGGVEVFLCEVVV